MGHISSTFRRTDLGAMTRNSVLLRLSLSRLNDIQVLDVIIPARSSQMTGELKRIEQKCQTCGNMVLHGRAELQIRRTSGVRINWMCGVVPGAPSCQ